MMWEYVRLEDDTQISYSEVREDNTVKIVVERPRDWGFDTAECILPAFNWVSHEGFSEVDRSRAQTWCKSVLRSVAASPDVTPS